MNRLILFDFDGTLTKKDSMLAFVKFLNGQSRFYGILFRILPLWFATKLKIASSTRLKERFLKLAFAHKTKDEIYAEGKTFSLQHLPKLIIPSASKQLKHYLESNEQVVIVTASPDIWINEWAIQNGIYLISTQLEWKHNHFSRIQLDCNYTRKSASVREAFDLHQFDEILAFGNSEGDKALLELADKAFYRHFH